VVPSRREDRGGFVEGNEELRDAATKQSLFREVNERAESLADSFEQRSDIHTFVCECANTECVEQISLPVKDYETIRGHPNRFIVAPGHVYGEVEDVISEHGDYAVVAKKGVGGQVAREADPRSSDPG
jgi:hypothetical protein